MTDTGYFQTIAINRSTNEWKVFRNFFPKFHHAAALKWLAEKAIAA